MTLPDFFEFEPFNRLRRLMNAPLPPGFSSGVTAKHLTHNDLDKALERLEGLTVDDISDVKPLSDGTLAYKDRRVLLYIRDRRPFDNLPKFHIANCRTLEGMRETGRFEKYVVSTRTDGKFKMNFIYDFGKINSTICELKVCINCLIELSYKGYKRAGNKDRTEIYKNFRLDEYFTIYPKNQISTLPIYTNDTAPVNAYAAGFREASTRYRSENGWRCENKACGVDLRDLSHQKYLHTHHINAQKYDDRTENYKALCIRCHAEEPMHAHLKNSPHYKEFMKIYSRLLQTKGQA
jgi:hypothetical protein